MPTIPEKLEAARQKFREEEVKKGFIRYVDVNIRDRALHTEQEVQGPLAEKQEMKNRIENITRADKTDKITDKAFGFFSNVPGKHTESETQKPSVGFWKK